jgi:hypothetical protein
MISKYSLPGMYDGKSECPTPHNEQGPRHIMPLVENYILE